MVPQFSRLKHFFGWYSEADVQPKRELAAVGYTLLGRSRDGRRQQYHRHTHNSSNGRVHVAS